ncbi:MAG: hypothetical protein R6X17_08885 [Candidatus Competibacteraceae bacterium]
MTEGQGFLHQVLGGVTAFAQHQWVERRRSHERLTRLRVPVEWVVDASEPRIRLVGNYVEKLADAVETALCYSDELLRRMPPPVTLASRVWAIDAQVNALFATANDLRETLDQPAIRAFFQTSARECFALMLVVKRETESFGMGLSGDMLVREIRQTVVSFSRHQLFFPAASENELRRELRRRTLVFLATRALENIGELRTRRGDLEERRRRLQARLRALRGHARGLRLLLSSPEDVADAQRAAALEQRLVQTEEALVVARTQLGTLDDYLEQVRQVLSQPEPYLQVRPLNLRLNRMGVKLDANSAEPGENLTLIELESMGERRIGALVRFARKELPPDATG